MHARMGWKAGSVRRSAIALLWPGLALSLLAGRGMAQTPRAISFRAPISYDRPVPVAPIGVTKEPITVADWDGDGRLDLAIVTKDGLSFLYGNGDGTFTPPVDYTLGARLHEATPADLNGDGALDLVICHFALGKLLVLRNLGGRAFAPPVHYPIGAEPVGITAADLNSDGATDLAVCLAVSGSVAVLLNRGDGTLQAPVLYGGGKVPSGIVSADVNGDGKIDLAHANLTSNDVRILLGDGTGKFVDSGRYPTDEDYANALVTDDFNLDGLPDLAVASLGNLSLLFGEGNGRFGRPVRYDGYHLLDKADLDGDGDPDLVTPNPGVPGFLVHQNHEAGNFLAPVAIGAPGNKHGSVRIGDFSGDGRPDVVGWNESGPPHLMIFLNDTPQPTPAVRSLTVTPANAIGGCEQATGEVTLTAPAPAGGAEVALRSSNPVVTVPSSIVVPAGATHARFGVVPTAVSQIQASSLSAAYNGTASRASLTVRPASPTALRFQPGQVVGGQPVSAELTFGCPVGPGGLALAVTGSNPAVAVAPAILTVAPGATGATFTVVTAPVVAPTTVTIVVSGPGVAATAILPVLPSPVPVGNYLVNGSFEDPGNQPHGTRSLPGWRVLAGTVDLVAWPPAPGQGRQSLDLVGTPGAATIEQTFATEPGRLYTFSGWLSHNHLVSEGRANVFLDGQFLVQLYHSNALYGVVTGEEMRWQPFSYIFRAAGATTTLRLQDVTGLWDAGGGAALDGLVVRPTDVSNPAPSPLTPGNLVVNGSFELPVVGIGWHRLNAGDPFPGWRITSGDLDVIRGYWNAAPAQGEQSIDLMGDHSATIEQAFATVPGEEYLLTGWYAHNVDNPSKEAIGNLSINGQFFAQLAHRDPQASQGDMRWAPFAYSFRAVGPTTTLAFTDVTPLKWAGGLALDGISVIAVGRAAPPPAAALAIQLTPGTVTGGAPATGRLTLSAPLGAGGVAFALTSSNPAVVAVPAIVAVAPGAAMTTFPVGTAPVATPTTVVITAVGLGLSGSATMQVAPAQGSGSTPSGGADPPITPEQPTSSPPGEPPVTTASMAPEPNPQGWHNGDVIVRLHATPGEGSAVVKGLRYTLSGAQSGGASVDGSDAEIAVTAEGTTIIGYSAWSADGASEPPRTLLVRIDRTAPVVTCVGNNGRYTVDQQVEIGVTATDALSGIAARSGGNVTGPAYAFELGEHRVEATATDRAGNTGRDGTSFRVEVTYESLCALLRQLVPNAKVATSLCRRLEIARKAATRRATRDESRALAEFTRAVKQQRGRSLTAAQVELLIRLGPACRSTPGR